MAQLAYIDLNGVAAAARMTGDVDAEVVWQMVLTEFGLSRDPFISSYESLVFSFLVNQRLGRGMALVFDNCDAVLELPAVFREWVANMRCMSGRPDSRCACAFNYLLLVGAAYPVTCKSSTRHRCSECGFDGPAVILLILTTHPQLG